VPSNLETFQNELEVCQIDITEDFKPDLQDQAATLWLEPVGRDTSLDVSAQAKRRDLRNRQGNATGLGSKERCTWHAMHQSLNMLMTLSDRSATGVARPAHHPTTNLICGIFRDASQQVGLLLRSHAHVLA